MTSPPFAFSSMTGGAENRDAPPDPIIMEQMAAGAFRALCEHLRLRSDLVQNIDLMSIGGFCRNCLAKVRQVFSYDHNFVNISVM